MELLWLLGAVVATALVFFFWPKLSPTIDKIQEDITEARDNVVEAVEAVEDVVEEVEEAKDKLQEALANLPTKAQLMKLTKAKIDDLAAEVGIELDRRQTKEKMVAELQKQAKKAKQ